MLDRRLVEDVAFRLSADAVLVEKDWYVVRALGVLADLDHGDVRPIFSGGTSLSKGWGLIKRFSEDIDFKVAVPALESRSLERKRRKEYRDQLLQALVASGFDISGEVLKGNADTFFRADFAFRSLFATAKGLRPHLRVEMTFQESALPPVMRPIQSLIGQAQQAAPEVTAFACIDPVETAADKLSALAWRVCIREHGTERDDPTIVRHLHDLAALESRIRPSELVFKGLVLQAVIADTARGGGKAPGEAAARFKLMLDRLRRESFWADDYNAYVRQVSFAAPNETITFANAMESVERLITRLRAHSA